MSGNKVYSRDMTNTTKNCRFGRSHNWTTALAAALNSNIGTDLPESPEWVYWCSTCDAVAPWPVEMRGATKGSIDMESFHRILLTSWERDTLTRLTERWLLDGTPEAVKSDPDYAVMRSFLSKLDHATTAVAP